MPLEDQNPLLDRFRNVRSAIWDTIYDSNAALCNNLDSASVINATLLVGESWQIEGLLRVEPPTDEIQKRLYDETRKRLYDRVANFIESAKRLKDIQGVPVIADWDAIDPVPEDEGVQHASAPDTLPSITGSVAKSTEPDSGTPTEEGEGSALTAGASSHTDADGSVL
jgi:hypothetical protein